MCWITGSHKPHTSIAQLSPSPVFHPTTFWNSASKKVGLQVHATTPGFEQVFILAGLIVHGSTKSDIFNIHWFSLLFLSVVFAKVTEKYNRES